MGVSEEGLGGLTMSSDFFVNSFMNITRPGREKAIGPLVIDKYS